MVPDFCSITRWMTSAPSRAFLTSMALSEAMPMRFSPASGHSPLCHQQFCWKVMKLFWWSEPLGAHHFYLVFQTVINIIDFGMTPLEAVGATRFHHQLLPPDLITTSIANPLPDQTIAAFEERSCIQPHWEFGDVQLIWRDGDTLRSAADPRDRGVGEVFAAAIER